MAHDREARRKQEDEDSKRDRQEVVVPQCLQRLNCSLVDLLCRGNERNRDRRVDRRPHRHDRGADDDHGGEIADHLNRPGGPPSPSHVDP